MRVIQLISSLEFGGVEKYAVQLHNELLAGMEFGVVESFFLSLRGGPLENLLIEKDHSLVLNQEKKWKKILLARRYILINKIDIIHAHNVSIPYAVIIKILTGRKLIFHNHHGSMGVRKSFKYTRIKLLSPFFDYVITVNERLEVYSKKYLFLPSTHVRYIPNTIFNSKPQKASHLPGDKDNRVVCLANLNPVKDHETLIEAFYIVVKKIPKAVLILIGDTKNQKYKQNLQSMVLKFNMTDNVFFIGAVINPNEYLEQCSIGVLASRMEAFPLSLLEYSYAGLAVVSTNVGQCSSLLSGGEFGILVTPGDKKILADSIIKLLLNRQFRDIVSRNFYEKVKNEFGKERIIKDIINTYTNIL
jgi:glycosyltransferase involved in cell wall biosynthesis